MTVGTRTHSLEDLCWRVVQDNGIALTESEGGQSIKAAFTGRHIDRLILVERSHGVTHEIAQMLPGPQQHAPVWYRRRSMGVGNGSPALDGIVFGWAGEGRTEVDATLSSVVAENGRVVVRPALPHEVDTIVVEGALAYWR